MKYKIFWALTVSSVAMAGCGGGGGPDVTAPVMSGISASVPTATTFRVTARAKDDTGIAAYCFKTTSDQPAPSDQCFQASSSRDFALGSGLSSQYVWAKDDADNVSANYLPIPCSGQGLQGPDATEGSLVCMMTSHGEMVFKLAPYEAPVTTQNFLKYVNDGFYSGTVFHRIMSNFMVQGGGFDADLNRKDPTYDAIVLEAPSSTKLSNLSGTIAMARTRVPDSATSQFFVNVVDNRGLDTGGGGYAVFGQLISGLDTLNAIKSVEVKNSVSGELSQPIDPPVILWAMQLQ